MSKWVESAGILEFIENSRNYKNIDTENFLKSIGISTMKSTLTDSKSFYKFNTLTKDFDTTFKNILRVDPSSKKEELYVVNSSGLRCDEFTTTHEGDHLLFTGCSVTAGEGLPLEFVWAKKTYDDIASQKKVSGYFNIAAPGMSIMEIIIQTYRYIDLYGNPDCIFINFPDPDREYYYLSSFDVRHSDATKGIIDPMSLVNISRINDLVVGMYDSLYLYCASNGIKLLTTTWSSPKWREGFDHNVGDPRLLFRGLNMDTLDSPNALDHSFNYGIANSNHPYKEFFYDALDNSHPGIATQDFYYKMMYNKYIIK